MSAVTTTNENVDISGNWKNELGSKVTFVQEGQTLSGKYKTQVERYPLKYKEFPLNGNIGTGPLTSVGFAVSYQGEEESEKSTCAWSGQYQIIDDKETIYTTWTLTKLAEKKENIWACTTISQDVFTRDA